MLRTKLDAFFIAPFRFNGAFQWPLVLIFGLINLIVLYNAIVHNPLVGYDSLEHLKYADEMAEGHLPDREDTREYFSPPLTYVLPALYRATIPEEQCDTDTELQQCLLTIGKVGQVGNVFLSLGVTLVLIRLSRLLRPDDPGLPMAVMMILAVLPVYYRSFAFVRGEPFVAFFMLTIVYLVLKLIHSQRQPSLRDGLILGLLLGLLILSRQWGFFLMPAVGLWLLIRLLRDGRASLPLLRVGVVTLVFSLLVGGWFYLSLHQRYGTIAEFNRRDREHGFDLANQPADFYFDLALDDVFSEPFRPNFANRLFPMYYTDTWGDYWGYFFVPYRSHYRDIYDELPPDSSIDYLARVMWVSLLPAALLYLGFIVGLWVLLRYLRFWWHEAGFEVQAVALLQMVLMVSYAGYFWFVVSFPNSKGDTIKPTLMLHTFVFLPLLAGLFMAWLRAHSPWLNRFLVASLIVVALHNWPMYFTAYPYVERTSQAQTSADICADCTTNLTKCMICAGNIDERAKLTYTIARQS